MDEPSIDGFSHIQVDAQADRNDGAEKNEETHDCDVPRSSFMRVEAFEGDQQE